MSAKKLLQINLCSNILSTGKIAEGIGQSAIEQGWESYIAYGMNRTNPSTSNTIKIGGRHYLYLPYLESLLFDNHSLGLTCRSATKKLIREIDKISPDVIQLHTVHCYYLNLKVLFDYLSRLKTPVVWTLHDCWAFTGHCAHFDFVNCQKWKDGCGDCSQTHEYPKSLFVDRSARNWEQKNKLFNAVENLTFVPVSDWIKDLAEQSFLKGHDFKRIYNGIDLQSFKLQNNKEIVRERYSVPKDNKIILGAASSWGTRKGLVDFIELSGNLTSDISIILVGLDDSQLKKLPHNIIGIKRTYNIEEMAELYSAADVFVNPTYCDTFPTVNLESLACGTPVVTYRTGGSPEAVDEETGIVVEKGDKKGLLKAILQVLNTWDQNEVSVRCRKRAEQLYDKKKNFAEYVAVYKDLVRGGG